MPNTKLEAIELLVAPIARSPITDQWIFGHALEDQITDQHEPSRHIRETSSNFWRSKCRDPGILSTSYRIHRAHFRHGNCNGQSQQTHTNETENHNRGTAGRYTDDENTTQCSPSMKVISMAQFRSYSYSRCHDAKAKPNHANQAKGAFELYMD